MKKLFVFTLVLFAAFSTKAQFGHAAAFSSTSISNVDTINHVITATAGYNALGVQVLVNKTSGTLAGKVYIYQSMDGVNYSVTDSTTYAATPSWTGIAPTYTNTAYFTKQTVPGVYYMVSIVTSGTVTATEKTFYTLRKNIFQ